MKVIQITSSLSYGDGVSNDCMAIKRVLTEAGYETELYAEVIHPGVPDGTARPIQELKASKEDIILYHLSIGTDWNFKLASLPGRKVIRYHNITPPMFFDGYNQRAKEDCAYGLFGARYLADKADYALADSAYNCQDLRNMGYQCEISVVPVVVPFEDYDQEPDGKAVAQYSDGRTNIVFVGRVVPNKCQEDIIKTFYLYKKYYDPEARLILAGSYQGMEKYYGQLQDYVKKLGVEDVIFTGHISFQQILAYYQTADIFLCMSEHEGFCIPLLEAMYFQTPIVAADFAAVGETMGNAGILLPEKDFLLAAGAMNRIKNDESLRKELVRKGQGRLQAFSYDSIKEKFLQEIRKVEKGDFRRIK